MEVFHWHRVKIVHLPCCCRVMKDPDAIDGFVMTEDQDFDESTSGLSSVEIWKSCSMRTIIAFRLWVIANSD